MLYRGDVRRLRGAEHLAGVGSTRRGDGVPFAVKDGGTDWVARGARGWQLGDGRCVDAREVEHRLGSVAAIQEMGIEALNLPQAWIDDNNEIYRRRRDRVVAALNEIGLEGNDAKSNAVHLDSGSGRIYSGQFRRKDASGRDGVVTPGASYGPAGEGYIRLSLTIPDDQIDEGIRRISVGASNDRQTDRS